MKSAPVGKCDTISRINRQGSPLMGMNWIW
jgi:hypothetical protein